MFRVLCWSSFFFFMFYMVLARPKIAFELYYADYVLGSFLVSVIGGFTLGMMKSSGRGGDRSFTDDFDHIVPTKYLFAFLAGIVMNLNAP